MAFYSFSKISQLILNRNIHTFSALRTPQDSRFMKKVLKENKNRKKWQTSDKYTLPVIPVASNLAQGATEGKRSANSRRVAVLNKIFMRHITDLMATGESASEFLGRGIEINRVMVTPDFKGVNVFWIAKGTEDDIKVEQLLQQHSGSLRHELSQLRVMGVVPKIYFVKDKEYAKQIEVDLRLTKADFGEDYVPVEPSYKFKSEFYLNTTLPPTVKEQIECLENDESSEEFDEPLPPMRGDVLGLNHTEIMSKVLKSVKKSQALHRKNKEDMSNLNSKVPNTINEDPILYESHKKQKEAFAQFLLKRQIMRAKAIREKDKIYPEYEYLRSENIRYFEETPFSEELRDTDLDYIEEQDDNKK